MLTTILFRLAMFFIGLYNLAVKDPDDMLYVSSRYVLPFARGLG